MMKRLGFATLVLSLGILSASYAQPAGAAGLVWLDNALEFDLNGANIVTSGAIGTTINISNQDPVCLNKNPNTLDVQLNLAALVGIPGLPTINIIGSANATGDEITWVVPATDINLCLPASQTGLPVDLLVKRITGGQLKVQATILGSPYFSTVCNRDFWVQMTPIGGNAANYLNLELYAFCVESPLTRINATVRDLNYVIHSGPVPTPASMVALGTGLASLLALRRRKK